MRRQSITVLTTVIAILVVFSAKTFALPGGGTEADPWRIESLANFNEFAGDSGYWGGYTRLETDISLIGTTYTKAPIAGDLVTYFTGVFDGNGYTISDLTVDTAGVDNNFLGLFGIIGSSYVTAEVKNLGVVNANITGADNSLQIGGLCGGNFGTISKCYATGSVSGGNKSKNLGALCGSNMGSISDCYTTGTVSSGNGSENLGGLCGTSYKGSISNCHSTSSVTGGTHLLYIGGLCGRNSYGSITDCYATGTVSGGDHSSGIAGLCGKSDYDGSIIDSYATGAVTGGAYAGYVGGLCGANFSIITNCRATGAVSGGGNYLGGLCGGNYGTINNCYATGELTGAGGGLGGLCGKSEGVGSIISNCFATGAVTGGDASPNVGGLCGMNGSSVSNCYATGDVYGKTGGGLFGMNGASVSNCYATGKVTGVGGPGGLCGKDSSGTITNCFWDRETSGMNTSSGGMSRTTVQMMSAATYMGWNQGDWVIDDGIDYPHLAWQAGAVGLPAITTDYPARTYAGNGDDQPFELANSSDIVCMSLRVDDWDKNFVVTSDIDMAGVKDYYPPFNFSGKISGSDHIITNLVIDASIIGNRDQLGFIGRLNGGEIEGLGLENCSVIGADYSHYLGGLCGNKLRGTISNCYSTSTVTGADNSMYIGGLCGYNLYGMISNSYASAAVAGGLGSAYLGGLCGSNSAGGSISGCYAAGAVSSGGSYRNCVGGLCGDNDGSISDCYATGWVTGQNYLGGLCGDNFTGAITNCYSTGRVSGGMLGWPNPVYIGGLCGYNFRTISNCFWDKGTSYMINSAGGTKKTTAQMKTQSTFTDAGWDFVGETGNGTDDIWRLCVDGIEYPKLWWEFGTGNFACGNGVNFNSFAVFADSWNLSDGDAGYNDKFDLADNNAIDIADLAIFAGHWLE